jgi:hypothetical protein
VTIWIEVDAGAILVARQFCVRVGMLVGRYLDDPVLVDVVAEHVVAGWLRGRGTSNVDDWWNAYVENVEAAAGGVDCASEDDLRRVWTEHARHLLWQGMADPLAMDAGLIRPEPVGAGR